MEAKTSILIEILNLFTARYLNNQHIRKQKISDAELNYGSLSLDHTETMKEIGELGLEIWKRQVLTNLFYMAANRRAIFLKV